MNSLKNSCLTFAILFILWASHIVYAESDEATLKLRGEIRGHSEQPKVLFIIPWQKPIDKMPPKLDTPTLIPSELLSPLDRLEFLRQTKMRDESGKQ